MGTEDKTPVDRDRRRPLTPGQGQHTHQPHGTNPYGYPYPSHPFMLTPAPGPASDDKKAQLIPEWLKFLVSAVGAVVLVSTILWKGGAIVNRFENLEKEFRANAAQAEQREKQRDLREQVKDADDAKWREEMNAKLSRLSITRNRPRRPLGDE